MSTIDKQHLATIFAMVLLTFIVCIVLACRRFSAGRRGEYPKDYFKLLRSDPSAKLPVKPEQAARNLINLFEMPVLFYTLIMVLIWTQKTDSTSLLLCWIFVAARYIQSFVHLGPNKVRYRFLAYLVGTLVLFATWGRLAVQLFL
jgi:hypothetical protein